MEKRGRGGGPKLQSSLIFFDVSISGFAFFLLDIILREMQQKREKAILVPLFPELHNSPPERKKTDVIKTDGDGQIKRGRS